MLTFFSASARLARVMRRPMVASGTR